MRKLSSVTLALVLGMSSLASFGQNSTALETGDQTTWVTLSAAKQESSNGTSGVVFSPKGAPTIYTVLVEGGLQKFMSPSKGAGYVSYANQIGDKSFAVVITGNKPVEKQLQRFPGTLPQVGMTWEVPATATSKCQNGPTMEKIVYKAMATQGPTVTMKVDGADTSVPTIQVDYTSSPIPVCAENGVYYWKRTLQMFWAPTLHTLVQSKTVDWSAYNVNKMVDGGSGWQITSIGRGAILASN